MFIHLVVIAWGFVVLMVAAAEIAHPQGSLLGAALTITFWGVLPISILVYLLGAPLRRAQQNTLQAQKDAPDSNKELTAHAANNNNQER